MARFLALIALAAGLTVNAARAEPQGGFPAQRGRATNAQPPSGTTNSQAARSDEVQRRQEEIARRDKAIMHSICRGC